MWHQTLFLKNQNASIFENSFEIIHGKIYPTILSQVPRTPIFYENRINLVTLGYSFVDMLFMENTCTTFFISCGNECVNNPKFLSFPCF